MAENYPSFDYPEPEEVILAAKNNLRIKESYQQYKINKKSRIFAHLLK